MTQKLYFRWQRFRGLIRTNVFSRWQRVLVSEWVLVKFSNYVNDDISHWTRHLRHECSCFDLNVQVSTGAHMKMTSLVCFALHDAVFKLYRIWILVEILKTNCL